MDNLSVEKKRNIKSFADAINKGDNYSDIIIKDNDNHQIIIHYSKYI